MRLNSTLFLSVSLVSGFGNTAMMLAAPVWTLALTGSVSLAAICGFLLYAPSLFGPAIGSLVDRTDRKKLLILTSLGLAAALTSLFAIHHRDQLWILFAVMLCYGAALVLNDAAESAILPASLPADKLGKLNGLRMSAQEGMKLVAPLAGAGLFAWRGGPAVTVLCIAALTVSAGLYALIRPVRTVQKAGRAKAREGVRYLLQNPTLRTLVLVSAVAASVSGFTTAAVYTVVTHDLARDPTFLGVLGSAQGAGSIVGGILAGRLPVRFGLLGSAIFGIGMLTWFVPWAPGVVAGSVIVGIGLPWTVVAAMTAVQLKTPQELLGRVSATATTFIFAPIAVAIPLGAGFTELVGHHVTLAVCAAAALVLPSLVEVKRRLSQGEAQRPSRSCDRVPGDAGQPLIRYPPNAFVSKQPAGADERTAGHPLT